MKQSRIVKRDIERNRMSTMPVKVPRTLRMHEIRVGTTLPAGKIVPLYAVGMLREDAIRTMRVRHSFEMHETAEILMNAVHVKMSAYLVPWLAFERFSGNDDFDKSYNGEPPREGEDVIPFFETIVAGPHGDNEVHKYMGLHAKPGDQVNTMYLEAYNLIVNHRYENKSPKLLEQEGRTRLQEDLAYALWPHNPMQNIVPTFDQAKIDGEVSLNVAEGRMPVKGIGVLSPNFTHVNVNVRETGATSTTQYGRSKLLRGSNNETDDYVYINRDDANPAYPDVYAELQENGITVSLANIELAKRTRAFAKLREQYNGHDDEYIIDMLMDGLSIPDQAYKHPIKLAEKTTIFGMSKRYATDAGNLAESAVNGATFIDLPVRVPRIHTGGVVMVVAEIVPEQLFEREKDPFFFISDTQELPQYLRDELDTEKVERVPNSRVDVDHTNPDDTFGFEPTNNRWNITGPKLGGRFYRPEVDEPFSEDRQRFWAVETQDPTLSSDFYIAKDIHTYPFSDQINDPFEVVAKGDAIIEGNTVFGAPLIEATDDYEQVIDKAPDQTIDQTQ